jgi:hypothetical protein
MQKLLKLAVLLLLLNSCHTYQTKYPYSLDDFRPEYRKHLENTIKSGIAVASYSYSGKEASKLAEEFYKNCSITDLKKILQCEHPLLRAHAFRILIDKDSNNIEHLLLTSLDDTAIISVDHGEFGITIQYCADYYLETTKGYNIKGYNKIKRQNILDILVEKHQNLETTFLELGTASSLPEKYYSIVKKMAIKIFDSQAMDNGDPYITYEDEKASDILFALSKYKNKNDIDFIKNHLQFNHSYVWQIIQRNPDTAYFSFVKDIFLSLEKARESGPVYLQLAFRGRQKIADQFENILLTLSKFKTEESAAVFSKIITQKLYPIGNYRKPYEFECTLYDLLKKEYCDEYKNLLTILKPGADQFKKQNDISPEESMFQTVDIDFYIKNREYW